MTVRSDVNHNRAVEGDEVAVLAFKLSDWFTVYKERDRVSITRNTLEPLAVVLLLPPHAKCNFEVRPLRVVITKRSPL